MRSPSPGRWISQADTREAAHDRAFVDWPTCSSCTPSGGGLSADPVQKQVLGERIPQKGID